MAEAYFSFGNRKNLGLVLSLPEQHATPFYIYHATSTHLYTLLKRDKVEQSSLCKETTQLQGLMGLNPHVLGPTMPPHIMTGVNFV